MPNQVGKAWSVAVVLDGMDLTDAQWAILEPLFRHRRRPMDAAGLLKTPVQAGAQKMRSGDAGRRPLSVAATHATGASVCRQPEPSDRCTKYGCLADGCHPPPRAAALRNLCVRQCPALAGRRQAPRADFASAHSSSSLLRCGFPGSRRAPWRFMRHRVIQFASSRSMATSCREVQP